MTAKEYLMQYKDLTKQIKILDEEITDLTAGIGSTGKTLDGMPKAAKIADKTATLATKLAGMSMEVSDLRTQAWEKRKEILDTILQVDKYPYTRILYKKYVQFISFEQIAVDMGYGYRHVTRLHGQALQKVDEILQQEKETCPIMSESNGVL